MFESGSYRSHPEHSALYDALESSMDHENREEFLEATSKSSLQLLYQSEQPIDDVPIPDDVRISDSEDTSAAYLPKIKTRPDWLKLTENNWADALAKWYKDPEENKLLRKTGYIGSFIKWNCKQIGESKIVKDDLEGLAYKLVKPFHKNNISLQFPMEECHLLLTDQIDLVNLEGDKERRNALSISKLKAAYYPDFRLEEVILSLWIEIERDYDISAAYDISHWWFKRKEFYITRHSAPSDHRAVRSHMPDYKEYKISEANFKNLHLHDFEDMHLLHLQGKLNHLSGANKVHLFNAVNLWIRNKVIRHLKLDFMVKDYMVYKFNLGMESRRWTEDDKRRSQEFIKLIEHWLKIRRIFKILERSIRHEVSSPFEDSSDVGSPGVDGPPVMPEDPYTYIVATYQAPPSPDYMPGPKDPQSPTPLDFVPELIYPEYMPLKDEILLAEEQPLPAATLPTADLLGYVPEDDDDEEDEEEPSGDDADDEDEDEDEDEEEQEEHPAPADSVLVYIPDITLPPRKRLGIDLGPRCEVGKSLAAAAARPIRGHRADYRFVDTVDAKISRRRAEEVGLRVTELATVLGQDTQDIYGVIEDTQGRQTQIYQRVETFVDDSQYHYDIVRLLDQEALVSREAWGRFMEVSYMARSEIMALRSIVMSQKKMILQLQAADRRRAACADFDIDAVTIGIGDSTAGTTGTL
ncbi:hypothetical protein Tco_0122918 [Tanacetum coccineum]